MPRHRTVVDVRGGLDVPAPFINFLSTVTIFVVGML